MPDSPLTRLFPGSAYDEANDRLMVFGGASQPGYGGDLNDVWIVTDASSTPSWLRLLPDNDPPAARTMGAVVYDDVRNRLIVHGGWTPAAKDTWVLSNANGKGATPRWSRLLPDAPVGRSYFAGAYDSENRRLIVFGGGNGSACGFLNDVWVMTEDGDAAVWEKIAPSGAAPAPRSAPAIAYIPGSNRLVVFGGHDWCGASTSLYNDVWILDNANGLGGAPQWRKLQPLGALPAARRAHGLVYDPVGDRLLVVGGLDQAEDLLDDVWILSGVDRQPETATWARLSLTPAPAAREGALLAYSSTRDRVMVGLGALTAVVSDFWILARTRSAQ